LKLSVLKPSPAGAAMNRKSWLSLLHHRSPGQLVVQITDHCNARCPQCGMSTAHKFPRSKLAGDQIKRLIDAAAQKGVRVISFTGGEPLLFLDDLTEFIKYAGEAGIDYIRTGTNGFLFAQVKHHDFLSRIKKVAEKLAGVPLRNFWISLDSADPAVHENMRGLAGVIAGLEKALPVFHDHGLYPSANLGLNRCIGGNSDQALPFVSPSRPESDREDFYQKAEAALAKFFRFVIDLGFTMVNTCYPMNIEEEQDGFLAPVYAATSASDLVSFNRLEKALLFKALFETVPKFRSKIRIFSPRTSLYALFRYYADEFTAAYPCRGGLDYFFIDCKDGDVYPCGYRGQENLGKYWDLDDRKLDHHAVCRQCDWECFRDPSELFGPVLQALADPLGLIKKIKQDGHYIKLWIEDLRYYRACDFFHGRKPPDDRRLKRF